MFIGRQAKRTDRKPRVHEVIRAQISPGMTGFAFYLLMQLIGSLNLQSSVYNATNGGGGSGRDGVTNSVPSYPSEINPGVSHTQRSSETPRFSQFTLCSLA